MKAILILLSPLLFLNPTQAQGLIHFNNRVTPHKIKAPVTYSGQRVTGPDFIGQLFIKTPDSAQDFEAAGRPVEFHPNPLLAGFIVGGVVTVPNLNAGEEISVILRAWNRASGSTWEEACSNPSAILGQSKAITITLGGKRPDQEIPDLPAPLVGLEPFKLHPNGTAPAEDADQPLYANLMQSNHRLTTRPR